MAFDGITIRSLIFELNNKILNGRIDKIAQPEKDETPSYNQDALRSAKTHAVRECKSATGLSCKQQ